ncbi:BBE domain-containing protein [Bacillus sp. FSL R12-0069]|uniref:BBE domain-containing protein n=1 Tax=Bacillus sp. FSL R12-0069 TaxID=2975342 RepID=UPI0030FCC6D0
MFSNEKHIFGMPFFLIKLSSYDLFWACQGGGGGNFGVVTSLRYRLPSKQPDNITFITISGKKVKKEEQKEFLLQTQDILIDKNFDLSFTASVGNSEEDGGLTISGRGIFYGTKEKATELLQPIQKISPTIEVQYFEGAVENVFVGNLIKGFPPNQKFKSGARMSKKKYHSTEITELVKLIEKRPAGSVYTGLTFYPLGGKTKQVESGYYTKVDVAFDDTAFPHRKADFIIGLQTVWPDHTTASSVKQKNIEWFGEKFKQLSNYTTGGFVNFPTSELPNYMKDYYGENADTLWEIKKKYDPKGLFTFPQSIRDPKSVRNPNF